MAVNKVLIWDLRKRQRVGLPLIGHVAPVTGLAFGRGGATLASSGADGSLLVWDLKAELDAAQSDGKSAAADANGRVLPVDAATGRPLARWLDGHRGPVQGVAFAMDGHTLVSGGLDGLLILWDLDRVQRLASSVPGFDVDWAPVTVSVSPAGDELALASGIAGPLKFYQIKTNKTIERKQVAVPGWDTSPLGYSPDGKVFLVTAGDMTNSTHFWRTSDWSKFPFALRQNNEVTKLVFSPDGTVLAGLHNDNYPGGASVWAWDPTAKELAAKLNIPNPKASAWTALALSPDGETSLWATRPERSRSSGRARRHRSARAAGTSEPCEPWRSERTGFLASGGDDNAVVFWDLVNPDVPPESQSVHRGPVICLAFDPFGQMLASARRRRGHCFVGRPHGLAPGPAPYRPWRRRVARVPPRREAPLLGRPPRQGPRLGC